MIIVANTIIDTIQKISSSRKKKNEEREKGRQTSIKQILSLFFAFLHMHDENAYQTNTSKKEKNSLYSYTSYICKYTDR